VVVVDTIQASGISATNAISSVCSQPFTSTSAAGNRPSLHLHLGVPNAQVQSRAQTLVHCDSDSRSHGSLAIHIWKDGRHKEERK
jgi:hypothetical protein